MRQSLSILFVLCTFVLSSVATRSQIEVKALSPSTPELKIKTILSKPTYNLNENAVTQTVFTNLSEKTLCFPKPDQERMNSTEGYLITKVMPPSGVQETEIFIDVIDGRGIWPREKLRAEIQQHWVKVPPRMEYTTESAQVKTNFNWPGEWRVQKTYRPPEGSFDPAGYRERMKFAALSVGCTLPETEVSAEVVTLTVHSGWERLPSCSDWTDHFYFGKFMRCNRSWNRGSVRRESIRKSALRK